MQVIACNEFIGGDMKILKVTQVEDKTALSRFTINRLEKAGEFPRRIRLGKNSVGWHEAEVIEWIDSRPRVTVPERVTA